MLSQASTGPLRLAHGGERGAREGAGKEEELLVHYRSPECQQQEGNLTTSWLKMKLNSSYIEV